MARALQVAGLSPDGRELLLRTSAEGRVTHSIAVDDRLTRALRGDDPDGAPRSARLTPRDIQARLRAGATVEEVAREAGVPPTRIERYAGPVRSEQEQVVRSAQETALLRPRAGRSARALGEAVAQSLAGTANARPETTVWTARREPDGRWTVAVQVTVRGRQRQARWRWDPEERELTSLDAYATQLGYVEAGSARRRAAKRTR